MTQGIGEPLCFRPLPVERVWGGNRLGRLLGKEQPAGQTIGESWELSDRQAEQSVVRGGRFEGRSLRELLVAAPEAFWDPALAARRPAPFPLLIKYVDAGQDLSVQVHPSDEGARRMGLKDRGKCECWYVVHADPGSRIVRGLRPGTNQKAFEAALAAGRLEEVLHRFEPRVGDVVAIPPGMVHAIGAGVVVAEIQQNSDLTFRVHDYGRLGLDGRPRALHLRESLETIVFDGNFGDFFQGDQQRERVAGRTRSAPGLTWIDYLQGRYFGLSLLQIGPRASATLPPPDGRPVVLLCTQGQGRLGDRAIRSGATLLLPADLATSYLQVRNEGTETLGLLRTVPEAEPPIQ